MLNLNRYFNCNTATAKNPASHKYEVANGINICKALLLTSGYSFLILFKNTKGEHEELFIRSEESNEMLINCSSSVVVKCNVDFSVNGS